MAISYEGMNNEQIDKLNARMLQLTGEEMMQVFKEDNNKELIEDSDKFLKARTELAECYEKLIYAYDHYLDWDMDEIKLQSIWDIATYFYNLFSAFPYKFVTAMKSSGKSRLLNITSVLACKGVMTAGMTDSALFRSANGSTLIFDEAESITSKDKKSQRLILNSGYKKGSSIQVSKEKIVDKQKVYVVESYPVYGPKMLANIWGMEEVLGSRCIFSTMEKSINPSKVRLLEDFDTNPFFKDLKAKLNELYVVWCMYLGEKCAQEKWNTYISNKYITTYTYIYTYNYTKLHESSLTKSELELFNKIDAAGLDGRHLELYFPLIYIAQLISDDILMDILRIAKKKTIEKKAAEVLESKDISLIEFISTLPESRMLEWTKIIDLTRDFKNYYESDENHAEWLNAYWVGRALIRLRLDTKRRRTMKGIEVLLDIGKAHEKLKIFKDTEVTE